MERLTTRNSEGVAVLKIPYQCDRCGEETWRLADYGNGEPIERLAHYEELQEQVRLLELPCAVGDTVYTNVSMQGWYFKKKNRPYEGKIVFIGINGADNFMNVDFGNGRMLQFNFSDIGKIVFLKQKEAKEALRRKVDANE